MEINDGPMKDTEFVGGIDVGGTKISSALVSRDGRMVFKTKSPTSSVGGDSAAAQIVERIDGLTEAARETGGRLSAIGICVPGIFYAKTGEVWAPNIPGWDHYPLRDRILRKEGIKPLVIDSDRSAYIAGESWVGAAAGAEDAVFLAVGTGIGAGILSGARLVRGSGAIAGAAGWFGLTRRFKRAYGRVGCFEAEAAGPAMAGKARRILRKGRPSLMRDLAGGREEDITSETVIEAARRKDPAALEIVVDVVSYLSMGIANIVSLLNPEVVVLGGGLFQGADLLLEPVRAGFGKWAQPLAAATVRIEVTKLGEDAGLYGCGRLAWESLETQGGD